jgi:hypothetical protein
VYSVSRARANYAGGTIGFDYRKTQDDYPTIAAEITILRLAVN